MTKKMFYETKPEHWRHAGWLPLLVAGVLVGILFTIGMSYSIKRLKIKKAAEQAAVDAKNGVVRRATEGISALKLLEVKTATGLEGALTATVKRVTATDTTVVVTFTMNDNAKMPIQHLAFSLIDIAQNGKTIKASNADAAVSNVLSVSNTNARNAEKNVMFPHAIGEGRQFLLYCSFNTADSKLEKSLAVPFQLR